MPSIRVPQTPDWQLFHRLAAAEGWKVPQIERQLFFGPWSSFAQVLVNDAEFCALITAGAHGRSGWIGNLIVPPQLRGHGYASRLFKAALAQLSAQGCTSVWLTASALGRPIYQKSGFVVVDRIERWVLPARQASLPANLPNPAPVELLLQADHAAWGESRQDFLARLARHGQVFASGDAVALLQQGSDLQIIGPWYSAEFNPADNRRLLEQLMVAADPALELVIDLFGSSPLRAWFADCGFVRAGQAELMAYGDIGSVILQRMGALASLGSIG